MLCIIVSGIRASHDIGALATAGVASMSLGRSDTATALLALLALSWVVGWPGRAFAVSVGPAEVSGSVGYSYRWLSGANDTDSTSHQWLAMVRASSYIWQPWFATTEGGVTFAQDSTEFSGATPSMADGGLTDNAATIVTGEFNLNVLPQSKTPFGLRYLATNSRIDSTRISSAPVMFTDIEFDTTRLELRQSYLNDKNDRFMLRYDASDWSSARDGSYEDVLMGAEADIRRGKQNVLVKLSQGTTEHSLSQLRNESVIADLSHFYLPSPSFRVDNKASYYTFDRSFRVTSASATSGSSTTDIAQASSFFFWRPGSNDTRQPWSMSGGVRVYDLQGEAPAASSDSLSVSASGGFFYQYSRKWRFDASAALTSTHSNGSETQLARQQAGVLYQSDLYDKSGFTYRWFATGALDNQSGEDAPRQTVSSSWSHNGQKTWFLSEISSLNVSVGQSVNGVYRINEEPITLYQDHQGTLAARQYAGIGGANARLDHTGTVAWNQAAGGGNSTMQFTLSDSRALTDTEDEQQLINFQVLRVQPLNRSSFFSGNLTVQYVRQEFPELGVSSDVATATGRVDYQHSNVFGMTNLRFLSNLFVSRAAVEQGIDRAEWDNRLDYAIGLLDTSLSLRLIQIDGQNSSLVMARIARRF